MSTGAVVGIVVGIIVGVAILAIIIMFCIRKRRDDDEDPLSPFELSMDKGYSATPGFAAQNSAQQPYNPRAEALARNDLAAGNGGTPATGAQQAGVAYGGFYDQAQTSPDNNGRHPQQYPSMLSSADSYAKQDNTTSNGTNLWMSAMEPKENDSYLSAQESGADDKSEQSSRNSYDRAYTGDHDASSEISGASDLNSGKDFPDYEDHRSSRGSYEL